jgi:hypothetical protein
VGLPAVRGTEPRNRAEPYDCSMPQPPPQARRSRIPGGRWAADAGLAILLVAAANVAALAGSGTPLRPLGAIVLVLVVPGMAFALAARQTLETTEVVLWVALSSIAVVILVGLLLDLIPGGLSERNWLVALDLVALVSIASLRWGPALPRRRPAAGMVKAALAPGAVVVAAVAIAAVAVVVGVHGARTADRSHSFVQLWAVPSGRQLEIGARGAATPSSARYRIVLFRNGARLRQYAFRLPSGRDWRRHLTLPSKRAPYVVVLYGPDGRALHTLRVTAPVA